ncbi:MAG TPA: Ig-like domain-containing protein [Gemmatimonadales bacterium]|nr:Ig-like domain-containing protein [Gemmatimonadales bacterium]
MPFTFKLSKRLALMKASLAAAAAALAACKPIPTTAPQVPSTSVVQVVTAPDTLTLNPYETRQFVAYGRTQAGDSVAVAVRWTASGGAIAADGLYTADTIPGDYLVTATAQPTSAAPFTAASATSPVSGSSRVKNRGQLAQVIETPSTASLLIGRAVQFSVYGKTKNGDSVAVIATWSSSNSAIATVSASGLVTGAAAGSATITAASGGKSAAATVTVSNVRVASVVISPATAGLLVSATLQLSAVTKDSAGNTLTGRAVTWSSGNPAVATVNGSGLLAGIAVGTATITATSEGAAGTAATAVTAATPGTVTDLAVVGVTDTGATVAFTEVNDGTGLPASYDVRYQVGTITWGITATSVTRGTCATPLAGTVIGAKRTCTVLGLTPATAYQFQLTEFRGTLNLNAIFGGLSNIAGATTTPSSTGSGAPQPGPADPIILQDGFESGDLSQWSFQSDAGSSRYSIATDPTRVHSGTRSLQVLFTPTNAYGMITRWFMPGYDEVYVKFFVLFEEGFQNIRPDGAGMHFFVLAGNNINDQYSSWGKPAIVPNGTDYFYAGLDPEEVSLPTLQPLSYYTYWPDMSCCYGNVLFQQAPKVPLIAGQWQEVVFHVKLNTPGQSDGSQTVWLNGVKKLDMQNMRWRTTTDLRLNEIRFDNYMNAAPQIEHVWVDDVTVWRP